MTLEQINNRQEQINGLLYTLLQDITVVVERIVGVQPEGISNQMEGYPIAGLLDEIAYNQNTTDDYIQKIAKYNSLLCDGTFAPSEAIITTDCTTGYKQVRTH